MSLEKSYSSLEEHLKKERVEVVSEGESIKGIKRYKLGNVNVEVSFTVEQATEKILSYSVKYYPVSTKLKRSLEKLVDKSLVSMSYSDESLILEVIEMKNLYSVQKFFERLEKKVFKR
jgi:hypothetical protein